MVKKQFNLRGDGQTGKGRRFFSASGPRNRWGMRSRFRIRAVEFLAGKIGGHSRLGVEETRKLAAYLGKEGGPITEELITELVPDFRRVIFSKPRKPFFQRPPMGPRCHRASFLSRQGRPPPARHPAKPQPPSHPTESFIGRRGIGSEPKVEQGKARTVGTQARSPLLGFG